MKKLLILGANPETVSLIKLAQSKGIYTIVTDYDPHAFAKPYADKSYNVDGMDVDGLVELAKKENIDGVIVGTADPLIRSYQLVCERLDLPCYANKNSVKALTNKFYFKEKCKEFGISGIPEFKLDKNLREEDLNIIQYPVLIKPTDSNSGKGMTICHEKDDLKAAIKKALLNSPTKKFLVEKYMTCDDMFVYYTFKDGKCYLSATADRYVCREQGDLSPVCLGGTYPSKHTDLYISTMHEKFCKMFESLGIEYGVLMITAFVENGNMYVYDPGFRLQGEAPDLLLNNINHFNQREMLIDFALTGSFNVSEENLGDYLFNNKFAATVWFLLKQGTIAKIKGLEIIKNMPEVVNIVQRFDTGDIVKEEFIGTEKQVFARFYIVCNNKQDFNKCNEKIQKTLRVFDKDNNNMLLKGYNLEEI